MNKEELLSKLSIEELVLLRDIIIHRDVINEIKSREHPKNRLEVKVGDCFIYKDNDDIYLLKVIAEEEYPDWFSCEEISIDNHDVDYYEVSYHLDEYNDWEPLDSSVYDKVFALIEAREDAVGKIIEQFDKQIRELCL